MGHSIIYRSLARKKSWKYELAEDDVSRISLRPPHNIKRWYCYLTTEGVLTTHVGYAWDGASGITYDSKNTMRGSLVHDVLYQLMREGLLDRSYRKAADRVMYELLLEERMTKFRASVWYRAVRKGGGPSVKSDLLTS